MQKLKNIRFNLRFYNESDEPESVHSVEELEEKLRNNQIAFDDFMAYFFSGQLERWLECHGEKDVTLLEKLRAIDKTATNKEIVKKLFAALDFCFDEQEIDRMIVSYDFPSQLALSTAKNKADTENRVKSERDEIELYEAACRNILRVKDDPKVVRGLVQKLIEKHLPILEIDIERFFRYMKEGCPLAVLYLLSNPLTRKFFDVDELSSSSCKDEVSYLKSKVKVRNNWVCCDRTSARYRLFICGAEVEWEKPFDCVEHYGEMGEWKVLVPKGRKIMVLANSGVAIRGDGECEGPKEWEESALNGRFLVLNGCSYRLVFKSKAVFAYMEL